MVCRQCGTLNPDGRERCFRCENALSPGTIGADVRCRRHPDSPRTDECTVCGAPMCDVCAIRVEGVAYCPDCAALPGEERGLDQRERVLSPLEMESYRPAAIGWRFLSGVIDGFIVLSGSVALALLFWMATGAPVGVSWEGGAAFLYWTLVLVGSGAFFVGSQIATGQTPGYAAVDLLVLRQDGTAVTLPMAVVRFVVSIASAACLMLGYLWMLWDPNDQTWHDKAAGTLVLRTAERIDESVHDTRRVP